MRQRVYGKDEIADTARALDTSIRNLNTTLKTMLASARSIDSAARDIAQGNTLLARRGRAQAETLAQAHGGIEQVGTRLAQGASDTGQARELAQRAHGFAARGGSVLQRLLVTMALLRGGTRRMADVAGVVDSLALQAQMLALSAAVEAVRAGEHGHGFAVVAAEVRALAQRSASAVLEIRALIDDTATALDNGTHTAGEAGASLTGLDDAVRQLADLLAGIDDSHARQARDVQDVRQAIGGMDQVTQQNLALVQQAAAAAGSLQRQALYLSQAVAAFKLDEGVAPPDHTCPAGSPRVVRLRLASVRT